MAQKDEAWEAIFQRYNIYDHDFDKSPFEITAEQIKKGYSSFFSYRTTRSSDSV